MRDDPFVILLVEDDQAHAEIVRRSLEGFRVANRLEHVCDGQAALEYLGGQGQWSRLPHPRPHLILLDLRLPKVDGLELLGNIKAEPRLASIPVVVLSTSDADKDMLRASENHANSYLVKPLDLDEFVRMIGALGDYWLGWNKQPT
ncbi:response regulator [Pelobacter propionicus]|uniref:Response regulator receiver protein n=1 Tax=Pelobacter propionicus (strain DSM 2379 / NBRC 103807 / OttBd1) TaxID=338966 RepID=A1ASK6_PELPD|nr:response regulator [Pelobacter propionicus]ABL00327.1 response regulator receiver protein [Pelobacter propionicus DSM 2379]